jgi:type I restriction enzyme, R subunit
LSARTAVGSSSTDQVRDIASALLEVVNIPAVAAQQHLLDEVAGEEWWIDVTLPMLELLRRRVRSLVRLVPKARRYIVLYRLRRPTRRHD